MLRYSTTFTTFSMFHLTHPSVPLSVPLIFSSHNKILDAKKQNDLVPAICKPNVRVDHASDQNTYQTVNTTSFVDHISRIVSYPSPKPPNSTHIAPTFPTVPLVGSRTRKPSASQCDKAAPLTQHAGTLLKRPFPLFLSLQCQIWAPIGLRRLTLGQSHSSS